MYDYGLVPDCALFSRDINNNTAIYIIYYTVINFHAARLVIEISSALGGRRMVYIGITRCSLPEVCLSLPMFIDTQHTSRVPFLSYRSRLVAMGRGEATQKWRVLFGQCNFEALMSTYLRGEPHAIKMLSGRNLNNFFCSVLCHSSSSYPSSSRSHRPRSTFPHLRAFRNFWENWPINEYRTYKEKPSFTPILREGT